MRILFIPALVLTISVAVCSEKSIDRHALIARHNIEWNSLSGQIPLGNGEFCFNVDATGVQTFGGSTMSHWAWHSSPLPPGCTPNDIPSTGTIETGRVQGPMRKAAQRSELDGWMFRNPHPINLARVRLVRANGTPLEPGSVSDISRRYDLWTGMHTSRFQVDGHPVAVETCVHPALDLVAIRAASPLLRDGRLVIAIDFPYPAANNSSPWVGDWNRPGAHTSELKALPDEYRAEIDRIADASSYHVNISWSKGCTFGKRPEDMRKKLTIVSARYGNGNSWLDVTEKVSATVHDNGLAITPSYEQFGDPLPGRAKKLQVKTTGKAGGLTIA